jgi:hypothetical protein
MKKNLWILLLVSTAHSMWQCDYKPSPAPIKKSVEALLEQDPSAWHTMQQHKDFGPFFQWLETHKGLMELSSLELVHAYPFITHKTLHGKKCNNTTHQLLPLVQVEMAMTIEGALNYFLHQQEK